MNIYHCGPGGVRYGSQTSVSKARSSGKLKIMTDGKSDDVNTGNSSWHFPVLECYFAQWLSLKWTLFSPEMLFSKISDQ